MPQLRSLESHALSGFSKPFPHLRYLYLRIPFDGEDLNLPPLPRLLGLRLELPAGVQYLDHDRKRLKLDLSSELRWLHVDGPGGLWSPTLHSAHFESSSETLYAMAFTNVTLTDESFNLLTRTPCLKYFYCGNIKHEGGPSHEKVVTELKRFVIRTQPCSEHPCRFAQRVICPLETVVVTQGLVDDHTEELTLSTFPWILRGPCNMSRLVGTKVSKDITSMSIGQFPIINPTAEIDGPE